MQTRVRQLQHRAVDELIVEQQQIEVERTRGMVIIAAPTELRFDCKQRVQQGLRRQRRFDSGSGVDEIGLAVNASHLDRTSCQSKVAKRNPGEVALPSRTRLSVFSSASMTKRSPSACSRITSSKGSRP